MSQVTLTWAVNNMTRVINDGFVIVVDWSCTASATGAQGAFYGGQSTYKNDPSEPGFIPYDNLTQEIVLGWVYASLGDQKAEIEATLTAKVEKQLNPTTAQGVPWNTAPVQAA
jgi:hypothetical protein